MHAMPFLDKPLSQELSEKIVLWRRPCFSSPTSGSESVIILGPLLSGSIILIYHKITSGPFQMQDKLGISGIYKSWDILTY